MANRTDRHEDNMNVLSYRADRQLAVDEFIDLLRRSELASRRPVDDRDCIEQMLAHANLLITAWDDERLVGVARSVTDFSYCCYLSDLAVDNAFQGRGIGRELVRRTRDRLGPQAKIILLSAPAAADYYPHIGFRQHSSAWVLENG